MFGSNIDWEIITGKYSMMNILILCKIKYNLSINFFIISTYCRFIRISIDPLKKKRAGGTNKKKRQLCTPTCRLTIKERGMYTYFNIWTPKVIHFIQSNHYHFGHPIILQPFWNVAIVIYRIVERKTCFFVHIQLERMRDEIKSTQRLNHLLQFSLSLYVCTHYTL